MIKNRLRLIYNNDNMKKKILLLNGVRRAHHVGNDSLVNKLG